MGLRGWKGPSSMKPVSSRNSRTAASSAGSSLVNSPLGMVQLPASLFFQKGPPGWTRNTSRDSVLRRYKRMPALCLVVMGMGRQIKGQNLRASQTFIILAPPMSRPLSILLFLSINACLPAFPQLRPHFTPDKTGGPQPSIAQFNHQISSLSDEHNYQLHLDTGNMAPLRQTHDT